MRSVNKILSFSNLTDILLLVPLVLWECLETHTTTAVHKINCKHNLQKTVFVLKNLKSK